MIFFLPLLYVSPFHFLLENKPGILTCLKVEMEKVQLWDFYDEKWQHKERKYGNIVI